MSVCPQAILLHEQNLEEFDLHGFAANLGLKISKPMDYALKATAELCSPYYREMRSCKDVQ
jgi:hypothetical protein